MGASGGIRPPPAWPSARRVEACSAGVAAFAGARDGEAQALRGRLGLRGPDLQRWPTLSPGERRRWQLGAALHLRPGILLLDEPSNHVDAEGRTLLAEVLGRYTGVGVLVSHDRGLLDAVCRRTLRLHRGRARLLALPYGEARAQLEAELAAAWQARGEGQAAARAAAARLAAARRERSQAEAARSRRLLERADHDGRSLSRKTLAGWAEARAGRKVAVLRRGLEAARAAVVEAPEAPAGRALALGWERPPRATLLSLDAAEVRRSEVPLLHDLCLRLGRADRVRLTGPNGAGKSSLLDALVAASTLPPGRLLWLPQELAPGAGAAALERVRALAPEARGRVLQQLAALGVAPARLLASRAPSPSEARKLLLALGLGLRAWVLVLDEPTNHLDLPSIERLEVALEAWPGALLLVSHDEPFAARITSRSWHIASGRVQVA